MVCILECLVSSSEREKRFSHAGKLQAKGFSPVWVRICRVYSAQKPVGEYNHLSVIRKLADLMLESAESTAAERVWALVRSRGDFVARLVLGRGGHGGGGGRKTRREVEKTGEWPGNGCRLLRITWGNVSVESSARAVRKYHFWRNRLIGSSPHSDRSD